MSYYYGYPPYVPVAKKIAQAKKFLAKKLGAKARPIVIEGKQIASTFWGKAWCENLEKYCDDENRLPRGRAYVKNGSVGHLEIEVGVVRAYVAGSQSQPYSIEIKIAPLTAEAWKKIKQKCAGEIASAIELLQGKLSKNVLTIITHKDEGLFPKSSEIKFECSCPDWAEMCKHIAAALYGVGALLDQSPELLFKLRGVDHLELIGGAVNIATGAGGATDATTIDEGNIAEIFGVEIASAEAAPVASVKTATKIPPKKSAPKKSAAAKPAPKKAKKKPAKKIAIKKKPVKKKKT
jgi:uncharacterized Zn finger protein